MTVETASVHNHLVMRDDVNTWRWFDAFGPNVNKWMTDFVGLPTDNTTGMPLEFVNTLVGGSTFTFSDVAGGAGLFTTDTTENDGIQIQLGAKLNDVESEHASFAGDYPTYFGVKFKVNDATQTDVLLGFFVTDTTALDGGTDGLYFRSIDEATGLYLVLEKDEAETTTACATLANDTYVTAEFYYDGDNVSVYINGTLAATVADTDANFPDDELLVLTMALLTGDGSANTMTMDWIRYIQIQG